jgi:hypothetical protein
MYPEYDGETSSDHRRFIALITHLRDSLEIPDSEILAQLPGRLKNSAYDWWAEVIAQPNPPRTWNEWAVRLINRFDTAYWIQSLEETIQAVKFTSQDATRPSAWISSFVTKLRSRDPDISDQTIKRNVLGKLPLALKGSFTTQIQVFESQGRVLDVQEFTKLFVDTISYNAHLYPASSSHRSSSHSESLRSSDRSSRPMRSSL